MKKIIALLILLFLIPLGKNVFAEEAALNAKSACLIETETGKILFEKNALEHLPNASMTKIMTLLIVFDEIKKGNLTYETMIKGTALAKSMGGSQIYLNEGEEMTLYDMIKSVAIASANDVAVALSEHISGTMEAFVKRMNEYVKNLGLSNTNFVNPTGLPVSNHYSCSYDMAMISRKLLIDHPEVLEFTKIRSDYIRKDTETPFWLVNTNKVLRSDNLVDGLKTGWTEEAGYCITLTKKKDNMRLIAVTMGYQDSKVRNQETSGLLNYGFSNFEAHNVLPKGTVIYEVNDLRFTPSSFKAITLEDCFVIVKKGEEIKDPSWEIQEHPNYLENKTGTLKVYLDNKEVGTIFFQSEEPVKKKSIFGLFISLINNLHS